MFFGTKLIKYQVSFGDPLNLWGFYSLTAPHYGKGSTFNPLTLRENNSGEQNEGDGVWK